MCIQTEGTSATKGKNIDKCIVISICELLFAALVYRLLDRENINWQLCRVEKMINKKSFYCMPQLIVVSSKKI